MTKKVSLISIGIVIVIVALVIGFAFSAIPPNCCSSGNLITWTETFNHNGTTSTWTFVHAPIGDSLPEPSFFAYPIEFFIAIIIGIIVSIVGLIRKYLW